METYLGSIEGSTRISLVPRSSTSSSDPALKMAFSMVREGVDSNFGLNEKIIFFAEKNSLEQEIKFEEREFFLYVEKNIYICFGVCMCVW